MAAPIVYRWDDSGAPVARGERASLCDILYACLVTGYGAKPAAGWTREYVNGTNDKAVFRPGAGTRFYLQIDGAGASNAYQSIIKAFESMSDVDNGLFPFKATWSTSTTDTCGLSSTANTTARPWVLIADDRFFYFFCWTNVTGTTTPLDNNTSVSCFFFGDIISRYSSDPYGCVLGSNQVQSYYGPSLFMLNHPNHSIAGVLAIPRPISGVATPILPTLIRGGGPGSLSYPGQDGVPYSAGGQILITRPHINEGAAYTMRGFLPGFYYPCHPNAFSNLQEVSADGKTFLSLRNFYYNQLCNHFILLDDWRA